MAKDLTFTNQFFETMLEASEEEQKKNKGEAHIYGQKEVDFEELIWSHAKLVHHIRSHRMQDDSDQEEENPENKDSDQDDPDQTCDQDEVKKVTGFFVN